MADATSTPSGLPEEEEITFELPKEEIVEISKVDVKLPTLELPNNLISLKAVDIEEVFEPLDAEQEKYKKKVGKYKQKLRETDTEITEYVCPNGEVGYQIFIYKTIDGKEYVKSFGKGPESVARTFDWTEVVDDIVPEKEIVKEIKK